MILIIDNYDSFTYNLYQAVAQLHDKVTVIRNDKIDLAGIKQLHPDGVILSPGPGRPESAGICIPLIQALAAGEFQSIMPVLGVCLGHQAIVAALGGNIVQANEIMHGKEDLIFHSRRGFYQQLPLPFSAGRYHSLLAERASLPADLIVEAENAQGLIMGIRHAQLPIYGVQFHPESILTPAGQQLLQGFVAQCSHYTALAEA